MLNAKLLKLQQGDQGELKNTSERKEIEKKPGRRSWSSPANTVIKSMT